LQKYLLKRQDMSRPKESFRVALPNGSSLSVSIFPTRNDPKAEVVSVEIRRPIDENWVTDARLALYRSPEGKYRQLPDREKPLK
jgi:hypothetical protein